MENPNRRDSLKTATGHDGRTAQRRYAYKEDWDETRQRLEAWWRGEFFGRCALALYAPKKNPPDLPPPPPPTTPKEIGFDFLDPSPERFEYRLSRNYYGGEALPRWIGSAAARSCLPAILGCPTDPVNPTRLWTPILTDPDRVGGENLELDPDSAGYRVAMAALKRAVRTAQGKAFVAIGPIGGSGDTLAGMRGTERLLLDCVERPEQIYAAEKRINAIWMDYYERCYAVTKEANDGGATNWLGVWAPGRYSPLINDFSFNVGPETFRDLFLPFIRKQTEFLDYSLYHLDGVDAFRHVDALLELPRLGAIQVIPGPKTPGALHFVSMLRKIQDSGKRVFIDLMPDEVEPALKHLSARLLYIRVLQTTEDEARQLERNAETWSVNRS
jgi:hypothetical protein